MTARTAYQATLLGDDPGSGIAWTFWRQGYERGVESGHAAGYAEGVADMIGAAREWQTWAATTRIYSEPTQAERKARKAAADRDADFRTGPELIAAAHASWGLAPTAQTGDKAA